jgi:hypothetical protein
VEAVILRDLQPFEKKKLMTSRIKACVIDRNSIKVLEFRAK